MYTYNQIVQINKDFWNAHKQIQSHYHDEKVKPKDVLYLSVFSNSIPFDLSGTELTYNFSITILDRPNLKEKTSNNIEIVSDCTQIAIDYFGYLKNTKFAKFFMVNLTSSIEQVEGSGEDEVTGVTFKIAIRQIVNYSLCQIPINNVPFYENENVAFIVDKDTGEIIFRLPMRQRYSVTQLQGIIDDLENNTTTIISPLN